MGYKEIAEKLCDGFLDFPCGCEACPIFDNENYLIDEDGYGMCELKQLLKNEEE